jgi:hypothetical protein
MRLQFIEDDLDEVTRRAPDLVVDFGDALCDPPALIGR